MGYISTTQSSSRKRFLTVAISLSLALLLAGALTFGWQQLRVSSSDAVPSEDATPYLGVTYVPLSHDVAARYSVEARSGVLITDVADGSPARWAGLRRGEVILGMDSISFDRPSQMVDLLLNRRPGDRVKLQLLRDGKTVTVEAVLAARPQN